MTQQESSKIAVPVSGPVEGPKAQVHFDIGHVAGSPAKGAIKLDKLLAIGYQRGTTALKA